MVPGAFSLWPRSILPYHSGFATPRVRRRPQLGVVLELQRNKPWPNTACKPGYMGYGYYATWKHPYDTYLATVSLGHFMYTNESVTITVWDSYGFPILSNGSGWMPFRNTPYSFIPGTDYTDSASWPTPAENQ